MRQTKGKASTTARTRVCPVCGRRRNISEYNVQANGSPRGRCKKCLREYNAAYREKHRKKLREQAADYRARQLADVEKREAFRERTNAACARWRKKNREQIREYNRKAYELKMSDPFLRAVYNEDQRIKNRLRAEREGRVITKVFKDVMNQPSTREVVSGDPLIEEIEIAIRKRGGVREAADYLNTSTHTLERILTSSEKISIVTADNICTALRIPLAALYPLD